MNATNIGRGIVTALALVMTVGTCGVEAEGPADTTPEADPGPEETAVDILVEVVRPDGRGVVEADVAVALTDGTIIQASTDGGGRVWVEAPPDRIASIVASKAESTFEALHGSFVLDRVTRAEPVILVLEPRDAQVEMVNVRGEIDNLADVANEVKITATVPDARFAVPAGMGTFSGELPAADPFVLLGLEWRRLPDAPARGILKEMVGWAHAQAEEPLVDGMQMILDFAPSPSGTWTEGEPFPWRRHDVAGTLLAPGDELLRNQGRADLSIHFLGAEGNGYLGGATYTEPTADGFDYAVSYQAPLAGAVETLVTVTAAGEQSQAWLIGPPPAGALAIDLLPPPSIVLETPDPHDAIQWALSPESTHDVTFVHLSRGPMALGRMILPPYLRRTSLPMMPSLEAEMELVAGPMAVVVETCATDPLRDRCERSATSAPVTATICTVPTCGEP